MVGLYVSPPAHAVALSVDEKSQIQALDRTQPRLPLKTGRHLERNYLAGPDGDAINVISVPPAKNMRLLARWLMLLFALIPAALLRLKHRALKLQAPAIAV